MTTENDGSQDMKNPTPAAPVADKPRRARYIKFDISDDEFALFNWLKFKHRPAVLSEWARQTLRVAAVIQARQHIAAGEPLKQGMAEVLTRVGQGEVRR